MFTARGDGINWDDIHAGLPQPECETAQSKLSGNLVQVIALKSFWYQ